MRILQLCDRMSNVNRSRVRANQTNPRNGGRQQQGTLFPSPIQTTIQVDKVFRYVASAALINTSLSAQSFFDSWWFASSAIAGYRLANAFRIRKLEMWAPSTGTTPVTISIEDTYASAIAGGSTRVKSDTSMGTNRPAHLVFVPRPGTAESMWQGASNTSAFFTLNGPVGTVVDLHISFAVQDGSQVPVAVTRAVAGATVGAVYVSPLDIVTGILLVPQSIGTI